MRYLNVCVKLANLHQLCLTVAWHLNIGSDSQKQRNRPDCTPWTSEYFRKMVSGINKTTGRTAPQWLAEQSFITFAGITLQIWQPEREWQSGPTCLFSRNFKHHLKWLLMGETGELLSHRASLSLKVWLLPNLYYKNPHKISYCFLMFYVWLGQSCGFYWELFLRFLNYISLLLHCSDDIIRSGL